MNKPKLLTWHDFVTPTGFSNVAKQLLKNISDDFETHIVAINHRGEPHEWNGCSVYPTDEAGLDPLGMRLLVNKAKEVQPDVVFLFQDYYNIHQCIKAVKEAAPKAKICVYFPIDGTPVLKLWDDAMYLADYRFAYSKWAQKILDFTYPGLDSEILYHGVDTEVFKPLSDREWQSGREKLGWTDKFMGVCVNRFQPRKQIAALLRVWSMFSLGAKECRSCGHKQPIHTPMCELCQDTHMSLTYVRPKDDVGLYLHMKLVEPIMGGGPANTVVAAIYAAGFRTEDLTAESQRVYVCLDDIYGKDLIPESQINIFYNLADVNLSTAVGEGAGLSLLESAAAGIPSIAPKHSAIPEMLGKHGVLVPNQAIFSMANDVAHARPIVNEWEMVKSLEKMYKLWRRTKSRTQSQGCIDHIRSKFLWDDKREKLVSVLKSLVNR
jgi:glycosyltransferase involved in cell wall biosynthesis